MSSWRRLHARYDAPETTGSVLRLHRGPLGFVVKIWDHLGPVFPSDHRFSGGGDGSEIGVGAPKTRISENPISARKRVERCSIGWVFIKLVTHHRKFPPKVRKSTSGDENQGSENALGPLKTLEISVSVEPRSGTANRTKCLRRDQVGSTGMFCIISHTHSRRIAFFSEDTGSEISV